MKQKDFATLGKKLASVLPGFVAHKDMLLLKPLRHSLRGVLFERSGFEPKGFYVNVFVQPLYVPADHEILDCGWRLAGGAHTWDSQAPDLVAKLSSAIRNEALPFLERASSPRSLADAVDSLGFSGSPACQRAIAYSLARAEDYERAQPLLEELATLGNHVDHPPWRRERAAQARQLLELTRSNPTEAQRTLENWENETLRNLGLSAFREAIH